MFNKIIQFIWQQENSEVRYEVVKNQSQVQQLDQKRVQKEWCCALCLVITTSKKCLKTHLHGKKHKAKEEELRISKQAKKSRNRYSPISFIESSNGIRLLDYLNQIAEDSIIFPVTRSCVWKKPGYGWTKLNTDGSMTNKRAGLGGLLRDYNGDPICAFVTIAPRDDIFSVELWAIWRGLVLALGLGIKVIWIESDSMSAVKTVDKKGSFGEKSLTCLNHIWEILDKFDDYKISHSWRETNRAADHLAKMVVLGSDDEVLLPVDFPPNLLNIIKDDAKGKIYHRGT